MKPATRKKLGDFDRQEGEVTERLGRQTWNAWHGSVNDGRALRKTSQELAELPNRTGYYDTLRAAASEATDPDEKREVELRIGEALHSAVRRDPNVCAEIRMASEEQGAFTYTFQGVEMTKAQITGYWQSQMDPGEAKAAYGAYLKQAAQLRGIVLKVVGAVNQAAVTAASRLGLKGIASFADVVALSNEVRREELEGRMQELLFKTRQEATITLSSIKNEAGVGSISALNDGRIIGQAMMDIGVFGIYPVPGDLTLELFRHVLDLTGFRNISGTDYLDTSRFGSAVPYFLEVIPEAEGAIRLGKGKQDYMAALNPSLGSDPREFTKKLFHEGGHILHYDGMDRSDAPLFHKTDAKVFREAMALVMEELITDPVVLHELGCKDSVIDGIYWASRLLETMWMRDYAVGGLFELELYRTPASELDVRYAKLVQGHSVLDPAGIDPKLLGGSWAASDMFVTHPGESMEYTLAFSIANAVLASLMKTGGGTAMHEDAAKLLVGYCYTGSEISWQARVKQLLEDTGMQDKPASQ